jgi:hypothetical protein
MRFVFTPPAEAAAGLLTLPWDRPLAEWTDDRLVEIRQRGLSRHVVRFVAQGGEVFAIKEIDERLARREHRLLRRLQELGIPAVEVLGVVADRPGLEAALVTRFLDYSTPYRNLFAHPRGAALTDRLLDALVELLVRLHLAGFLWGDCSLSNTLFRHDAGAFSAYLVDAETGELHPSVGDGMRTYDVTLAFERVGGELFDLEGAELLPPEVEPVEIAEQIPLRYERLWRELTHEEVLAPGEQRYRIAERLRRLNELGFDVDELELVEGPDGNRMRVRTRIAEPGHHRRLLMTRTGIDAEENQARRLLNDITSFRGWLEHSEGRRVPEAAAASRWLTDVYDPVVASIPEELRGRLDEAEIFHEVLEHRWFLSEAEGRDVGTSAAAADYITSILPAVPPDLTTGGVRGIIGP